MEVKKSSQADLEAGRPWRFLLGLVFALTLFFVALEYNIVPSDPLDDPELMEELTRDMDMAPLFEPESQLAQQEEEKLKPTVKLEVVDNEVKADEEKKEETDVVEQSEPTETAPTEEPEPIVTDENEQPLDFRVVEDLPQPPGGMAEFTKWLTKNLKYPEIARQQKIQGKVLAQFIVNKDGSISDLKIAKPLHFQCDREALRVLKLMGPWTPGIQNDKPCRTMVCIPIVFML